MKAMQGIIQQDGGILGDDGKTYTTLVSEDSILIVCSSWRRLPLSDVVNKRVKFVISKSGYGYNYELIEKDK